VKTYCPTTTQIRAPATPQYPRIPSGEENFAGTALGLDNDGDGAYDMADANCDGVPVELMTFEIE